MNGAIVAGTWRDGHDDAPGLLTLARRLGAALDCDTAWLALRPALQDCEAIAARYGVREVHRLDAPALEGFQPDLYVEALAQYCLSEEPSVLLFSQTFDVRFIAARLAGRLRCGVVMNGLSVDVLEDGGLGVTASAYGGDTRATYVFGDRRPCIVSVMPNTLKPQPAAAPSAPVERDITVDLCNVEERIRVVSPARGEGPRLEDAQVIVAGGRGLGNAANFALVEELAEALGGVAGASRPIVDDGWTDPSRQVGLTGKITRPALYIAAGVSGASQHMAGCSAAGTIVAINRDPDAPIFRYARFGAVGDCLEILPEMVKALQPR